MTLTLSVLRCPDSVPPETRQVAGGEFSLGRGPDNDWTLADPDRFLSKRHCVLAYRSGAWQLADVSTNGTFVNRDAAPLGQGAARELRDGDRIRLGSYEIEIRIAAEAAWSAPKTSGFGADPFDDDPFAPRPAPPAVSPGFGADPMLGFGQSPGGSVKLPDDFDPLGPDFDAPFTGPTQSDHASALEHQFVTPRSTPGMPADLDDWDLDLTPKPAAPDPFVERGVPAAPLEPPPPAAPPPPAEPVAEGDLLAAFLQGAGMQDARPADPQASMLALGAAFRAMVGGLRQALIARAAVKGEFRIEQTMIRARGNNPLKFSAGDDDALAALLGLGRRADMTAAEAVAEVLRDMRLHELATMAAMQSAVRALLDRLDPAALRAEGEKAGGLLGAQKRARAFESFERLHGDITRALADDFDSVFGKAFARAYEQALREVARKESP